MHRAVLAYASDFQLLATALQGVISLRLVPRADGRQGRGVVAHARDDEEGVL